MSKISINLLPPEIIAEEAKNTKFYKIQFAGVFVILLLIFLTSLTLALQILQNRNITTAKAALKESEEKAEGFKKTQSMLFLLKNRLDVIGQYLGVSSKQVSTYKLIDRLIPASGEISSVSVDKSGNVILLAQMPDSESLDLLISNLADKEKNEGLFDEIAMDSLNRGKNSVYRVSLKVKLK